MINGKYLFKSNYEPPLIDIRAMKKTKLCTVCNEEASFKEEDNRYLCTACLWDEVYGKEAS